MGRHKKQEISIDKHIRIPKELDDIIETEAKKGSSSYNSFLIELLEEGIKKGSNKAKETLMKINAKFEGKCLQCEKTIKVSQTCWWAREVGIMCEECHQENELEGIGDSTLSRLYRRKRHLTKTCQGLKKECDEFADRTNEMAQKMNLYSVGEILEESERRNHEIMKLLDDYLRKGLGTPEETRFLKDGKELYEAQKQLQTEIRQLAKDILLNPVRKRKKKKEIYSG